MKQFCECFWGELKKPSLASTHKAFLNLELSSLQKNVLINCYKKGTETRDTLRTAGFYHFLIQL